MKPINTTVLKKALNQIERFVQHGESENSAVSKVNVAWHLDHSLKVINAVITNMSKSDPALYTNNFSFLGKVFFTLGFFPRGKAKAPKHVMPPETILTSVIITQLEDAKHYVNTLTNLPENAFFKHPLFGNINSTRVVRFLNMHTKHHLKIVAGILK